MGRAAASVTEPGFDEVYQAYQPRILGYLRRLAGDDDAEDLAQEVFLRVSRSLSEFRGQAALSTWIYRIATNAAVDRIRQRGARPPTADIDSGVAELPLFESRTSAVEALAARREMNDCIRGHVEALPPPYRAVVILSDLEGMSTREIAAILGVSAGAVKTRLHRARARLKQELEAGCNLYRDERNELACEPVGPPPPAAGAW